MRSVHFLFLMLVAVGGFPLENAYSQIQSVSFGWQGQCKLGYWVPARIVCEGRISQPDRIEITVPDTDGINTTFVDRNPSIRHANGMTTLQSSLKLGRAKGLATIRVFDSEVGQFSKTVNLASICNPADPLLEFYVSLGRSVEIASAAKIGGKSEYAAPLSVGLDAGYALSPFWKNYESIDGLIVEVSDLVDSPWPENVQSAITTWVKQGGRLAITGGADLQACFDANPILASLFSGEIISSHRLQTTTAIERILKADEPVSRDRKRQTVAVAKNFRGKVLIQEGSDAIVIRERVGFGQLVLVTVNLAEAPLGNWSERKRFSGYVISLLNHKSVTRGQRASRGGRYGYKDLIGQLRTALDHFASVSMVNFTVVAAIAILFIGLIGPADYFFLKKVVRQMEWTWLSFLLIVLLISALTFVIHRYAKSDQLLCRQVEIVDVDTQSQTVRGTVWAHLYSPVSSRYDVNWSSKIDFTSQQKLGSWLGFPGNALGGMGNNSVNGSESSGYSIETDLGSIRKLPINVAATRGVQLDWTGTLNREMKQELGVFRGDLTGRLKNPLEIELENVLVVFGRSVYLYK
ncbi:MAG: hypothetical protein VX438_07945, partial [Planctomycetota bacterium]|nr:hypothetical protein [Planctomycetota bacterium]